MAADPEAKEVMEIVSEGIYRIDVIERRVKKDVYGVAEIGNRGSNMCTCKRDDVQQISA